MQPVVSQHQLGTRRSVEEVDRHALLTRPPFAQGFGDGVGQDVARLRRPEEASWTAVQRLSDSRRICGVQEWCESASSARSMDGPYSGSDCGGFRARSLSTAASSSHDGAESR
ncbi:hypothetical protein [Streptomyces nigrescens]